MTTNTEIKTWQQRVSEELPGMALKWLQPSYQIEAMEAEIADLRAALQAANTRIEDLTTAANRCINDALAMGAQPAAVQPDSDLQTALTVFDMGIGFALCHRDFADMRNAVKKLQEDFTAIRSMVSQQTDSGRDAAVSDADWLRIAKACCDIFGGDEREIDQDAQQYVGWMKEVFSSGASHRDAAQQGEKAPGAKGCTK